MAKLILVLTLMFIIFIMGAKVKKGLAKKKVISKKVVASITGHIIGGRSANIAKFPYQTSQREKKTHKHFCGGAILSEKFIVTAAHCVCFINKPMTSFYIWVGSTSLSGETGVVYDIEHSICHAKYNNDDKQHDIGLIGVKKPIHYRSNIRPISIYMNEVQPGTMLTVSGWGYTVFPSKYPDILQKLDVPAISFSDCKNQFTEYETVVLKETQLCTLLPDKSAGTCRGDSGGPLTLDGQLVGVVSWGVPCAQGKPDVFTKLSSFKSWISQTMKSYCKTKSCPKNAKLGY